MVDVVNPAMVDALLEHARHTSQSTGFRSGLLGGHGNGEVKSGVLQKPHGVTSSVSWGIVSE